MATTFDTLKANRDLKAAGFDDAQAEVVVTTIADAFSDTVATKVDITRLEAGTKTDMAELKADIARLEASTKADIDRLEANTKADMAELRADIARLEANTKADIDRLEANTKADVARLEAKIADLKAEIFRALWIQGAGIVALVVGLTKVLFLAASPQHGVEFAGPDARRPAGEPSWILNRHRRSRRRLSRRGGRSAVSR